MREEATHFGVAILYKQNKERTSNKVIWKKLPEDERERAHIITRSIFEILTHEFKVLGGEEKFGKLLALLKNEK